ncbi:MAG: hypothetical protein L0Y44_14080 [Phycisphaerales bacterium]|nr:hypothetical protein [Phycisphaerales bacterium]MCI0631772.1 hypothetical protein [Phycisphaerales bacterium]
MNRSSPDRSTTGVLAHPAKAGASITTDNQVFIVRHLLLATSQPTLAAA